MGAFQPLHLMLVALVVLLVFGPRKLPELARGIGESMKELKHSLHGVSESEEVLLVQEVGRTVQDTVQDLQEAANPLTPPVRNCQSGCGEDDEKLVHAPGPDRAAPTTTANTASPDVMRTRRRAAGPAWLRFRCAA